MPRKLTSLFLCLAFTLATSVCLFTSAAAEEIPIYPLPDDAAGYIVIDADTGAVVIAENKEMTALPASTTKIMTIALSLEMLNADDPSCNTGNFLIQ